jgi:hypothetical protein
VKKEVQVLKTERDIVLVEMIVIVKEKEEIIHQTDVEGHQSREDTHLHRIEEEDIHLHLTERKDILLHLTERRDFLLHLHQSEKILQSQILNKKFEIFSKFNPSNHNLISISIFLLDGTETNRKRVERIDERLSTKL